MPSEAEGLTDQFYFRPNQKTLICKNNICNDDDDKRNAHNATDAIH
jgi:hypothetical protein